MFIARDALSPPVPFGRAAKTIGLKSNECRSSERSRGQVCGDGYKHATPNGVKSLRKSAIGNRKLAML